MATQTATDLELQTLAPVTGTLPTGATFHAGTLYRSSHERERQRDEASVFGVGAGAGTGIGTGTGAGTETGEKAWPDVLNSDDATTGAAVITTRAYVAVGQLMGSTLLNSFCSGVTVVGLPAMASTLQLQEGLLVWPTSVFYLTAGSCLLMAGSVADVVGTKRVNLFGCLLGAAFALGCGLARTGSQLIAFRALQGVSNAIIVPSSVSIIARTMSEGRPRNISFACLGFAAPVGFLLGLVLGGVFVDSTGWRPAFYLAGAATFALCLVGLWALPQEAPSRSGLSIWKRLASEIDWVGAVVASTGLATMSYVLA
jgi:MFS family permease